MNKVKIYVGAYTLNFDNGVLTGVEGSSAIKPEYTLKSKPVAKVASAPATPAAVPGLKKKKRKLVQLPAVNAPGFTDAQKHDRIEKLLTAIFAEANERSKKKSQKIQRNAAELAFDACNKPSPKVSPAGCGSASIPKPKILERVRIVEVKVPTPVQCTRPHFPQACTLPHYPWPTPKPSWPSTSPHVTWC